MRHTSSCFQQQPFIKSAFATFSILRSDIQIFNHQQQELLSPYLSLRIFIG